MYPFFSHLPVTVLLDRTEANSRFRNHLISLNDLVQFDLPYRNEAVDRRMQMAAERYAGDFYEYSQPHIHERMEILYMCSKETESLWQTRPSFRPAEGKRCF